MRLARRVGGFTLIEILVALAIFAIMAVMSYRALAVLLDSRTQLNSETEKWRNCAIFFTRVESDLQSLLNRSVRSADDLVAAPLSVNPDNQAESTLTLTRAGYAQAEGTLLAPQRVGYRLRDGRVEMLLWSHLDAAPRATPQVFPALPNVSDFKVRLLDARANWQTRWPMVDNQTGSSAKEVAPELVEMSVTLKSGETITRLFAMRSAL